MIYCSLLFVEVSSVGVELLWIKSVPVATNNDNDYFGIDFVKSNVITVTPFNIRNCQGWRYLNEP